MFEGQDYIGENVSLPGKPTSVWIATEADVKFLPVDFSDKEYDVVIVGAGIVGITTAYFLTKADQKVLLVDMRQVVKDVTGHTTAKITSLHGLIYDYLIKNHGIKKARLYAEAQEEAKSVIASISRAESIDCDLRNVKAYTFSETEKGAKEIRREIKAAKRIGLPLCPSPDFNLPLKHTGVICFENQAQFHPRKYLVPLAKKINLMGCEILENNRVTKVNETDDYVELETQKGIIRGKRVVIASNYPFYDTGAFFTKLEPKRSYAYAVKLRSFVPEGLYYSFDSPTHTIRPVDVGKEKWLIVGGESHKAGQSDEKERYKALEKFAKDNFDIDKFEYHWSTQDNTTTDRLPYIGLSPKSKRVYIATGFGGWGMTNGTIAGKIISDLILEKENKYAELFNPSREKPVGAFSSFFKNNINIVEKYFSGKKLGGDQFALPSELKPGGGSIIEYGDEKVAAYKDKNGKTISLSPKCTHLGCTVKWDGAERTWDCPCHGSRYSAEGEVIHGPAVRDLEKKDG